MRRLGFVLGFMIVAATPVGAAEHVVSRLDVAARLAEARTLRQADLSSVDALLATPAAVTAAARAGLDVARVRAAVGALDDAELHELAVRASALRSDPTAGLDRDIHDLLVLFLIIAIVVLVLQAVN
jgi:hypothetical protein